jgi:phosphoglycolate phosphatase-like HAD superfamily hydrolase
MPFQIGLFEATALVYPVTPRNGDEELLEMLRFFHEADIRLVTISTEPEEFLATLNRMGIVKYFERVVLGVGDKQAMIQEMLQRYPRVDRRDVFYVDIAPEGIVQAKKAKIVPFALTGRRHSTSEMQTAGATWIIHSYGDLTSIIRSNID